MLWPVTSVYQAIHTKPGRGLIVFIHQTSNHLLSFVTTPHDIRRLNLDGVWYRLPSEKTGQAWLTDTPPQFIYAPKAHREISHIRRLRPEGLPILMAMLQRLKPLHMVGKLGPILIQLPPNLKRDDGRLETFLGSVPTTHQWAIEFWHESWQADEIERILRQYSVSGTAVETDEYEAEYRDTARFRYVRLRKHEYSQAELRRWAERFQDAFQ